MKRGCRRLVTALALTLPSLALLASAGDARHAGKAREALALPFVTRNVCPSECCEYRRWVANRGLRVFRTERDTLHLAFSVAQGDSFDALDGDVYVTRPGVARVLRARQLATDDGRTVLVRPGDRVALLHFAGDAGYHAWFRGRFTGVGDDDFWYAGAKPSGDWWVRMVREPVSEWWVRIRTLDGREGWIWPHAHDDENLPVGNTDSCD